MKVAIALLLTIAISTGCKTGKHNASGESNSSSSSRSMDSNSTSRESASKTSNSKHVLDGNWFFVSIPGKAVDYAEMFPNGMPSIDISVASSKAAGFSGCNKYSVSIQVKGDALKFDNFVFITKAACPSMGDQAFSGALQNSLSYSIKGTELTLYNNKVEMMKLRRSN